MTWTREKHVAAILNDIDPRLARAADALLDAGLIRQVGERRDDDTGKMRPVYQFIKTAENKSKWIETLCALPSDVLDAFENSLGEGAVDATDETVDWFEGKPECRRTDMVDKAEVSRQLRALVEERLFGNGPWRSDDRAVNQAVHDKLCAWGLQTVDLTQTIRTTELGSELQVELMTVFMAHHVPYEAPDILRSFGLITPMECDELTTRFNEDGERPEDVLPPLLRRLWRQHFNRDAPITH